MRYYMRDSGDHILLLQINQIGSVLLFLTFFDLNIDYSLDLETWILFLLSGIIWSTAVYFDVKSYRYLDVAVSVILTSSRYLILSIAGFLFFTEPFSLKAGLGMLLILVSIFLVVDFNCIDFKKGALLKSISICATTIAIIIDKKLSVVASVEMITFISFLFPCIMCILLWWRQLKKIPLEVKNSKGLLLLMPFFLITSYYLFIKAFGDGELSITIAINQTSAVVVFLFGLIFLGERSNLKMRAFSSVICVLGAILVAIK